MVVRSVARPSKVYRVSGSPGRGRATFVAMSPGTQTVMNGNARNYRPETDEERDERGGVDDEPAVVDPVDDEPDISHEADPDAFGIAELCVRMQDAVARVADGDCDSVDAAAIVTAAAALNDAVVRRGLAGFD
jgi:hypothetical protein